MDCYHRSDRIKRILLCCFLMLVLFEDLHGAGEPEIMSDQPDFTNAINQLLTGNECERVHVLRAIGVPMADSGNSLQWDRFRVFLYPSGHVLLTVTTDSPREGLLLLYTSEGELRSTQELPRIESVRQIDLDADGVCELLIESHGAGTGISLNRFHIFRISKTRGIQEVWSGVAESTESIGSIGTRTVASELSFRFPPGNSGAELLHIQRVESREKNGNKVRSLTQEIYEYNQLKAKLEKDDQQ